MIDYRNIETLKLVHLCDQKTDNKEFDEDLYLAIREIVRRQLLRMSVRLNPKQRRDLCHLVATNVFLFLIEVQNKRFKISNWIKYLYNKAYKTYLAVNPGGIDQQKEIISIEDVTTEEEFIERYFFNQLEAYRLVDQSNFEIFIDDVGKDLTRCIKNCIRYNSSYQNYNNILITIIIKLLCNRDIKLTEMKTEDLTYSKFLFTSMNYIFPKTLKESLIFNDSVLPTIKELKDFFSYERLKILEED